MDARVVDNRGAKWFEFAIGDFMAVAYYRIEDGRVVLRAGIPRSYLSRLREEGVLLHLGRGLYQYAEAALSTNQSLAGASKRVPHNVM